MVGGRQRSTQGAKAAGRGRVVVGLLCAALAVVVGVTVVSRYVLQAEWWQVRHHVTSAPAVPQSAIGPPPGPLSVSWQRSAPARAGALSGSGVAYQVAQGQVVTASGRGLEVADARTGTDRWSYHRSGWTMAGWSATGSRLVGYFERTGNRDERQMVAFDALSGGLMWRRDDTERPAAASRATLRWPGGSGVVTTTDERRRTLYGRSADDGSTRWTLKLPTGCRLFEDASHPADGDESLSVLALDCPDRSRLLAVEPGSGRVRWVRSLGSGESPEVRVLEGVTVAADGTALRAYDKDGTQVVVWNGDEVCGDAMCPAVIHKGHLVVAYRPDDAPTGTGRMESVEVASGRSEWARDVPWYAALTEAGGRLYALRPRLDSRLMPAGIDVIEPADGRTGTVPAPFALDPALTGVRPWLAASGGLLYVAVPEAAPRPTGSAHLFALRGGRAGPGPAELGGVAEKDWPDACGLIRGPDLAAAHLEGARATGAGRAEVGGIGLPHPVTCTYEQQWPDPEGPAEPTPSPTGSARPRSSAPATASPSRSPSPSPSRLVPASPSPSQQRWGRRGLTVTVKWVAPTAPTASALLQTFQATQSQARRRTDIGADEAYEIGPTAGTIALRVDRYIVMVDASQPPGAATRLARVVATRLPSLP
ncbi:PQQ-binding-like beta-propeller repeat protein [Actinomadura sp. SCN-SB]|uniref:outer membrane protein assembly factor BamB family protein n=1 Tax=Actinomadura sp. SCN-SB TaxID=3373092 RepID=UPI00375308AD